MKVEYVGDEQLEESQSMEELSLELSLSAVANRKNIIAMATLKGQSLYLEKGSS